MSYFISPSPAVLSDTHTYSAAFPPLQAFPWAFSNNKKAHTTSPSSNITSPSSNSGGNTTSPPICFFAAPLTLPKYPSYLKYTSYANLVLEQYNNLKNKRTTSNDDLDLRLPQFWDKIIKSRHLEIGLNGYDLNYHHTTGPGNHKKINNNEPVTVRTNFPMRPQCGIYYFEIRVIQKGQNGHFAIGFSRRLGNCHYKLPGCDQHSYGYHGQNGQVYQHASHGHAYGPSFSSGDIIGCGINFATKTAFFTKNGVSLGCVFESIDTSELLYPCMGLSTCGEKITANFGQEPFVFDIVQYVKDQQTISIQSINTQPTTKQENVKEKYKKDIKSDMDQLVLSYLLHQGYTQTAKSLMSNIQYVKKQDHSQQFTLNNEHHDRNVIRKSIMSGSVDTAVEQTRTMYPGLLEKNQDLLFQLKTRKFLDILNDSTKTSMYDHCSNSSDTDDDTISTYSSGGRSRAQSLCSSIHDLHNQILYEEEEEEVEKNHHATPIKPATFGHFNATPPLPVAASGRRLSWAAIAASPTPSFDSSVVEEMFTTTNSRRKSITSSSRTRRDSISSLDFSQEDEEVVKRMSTMVRKAMNYGHQLQEEYQSNSKYSNKLMGLFTLLTYSDPRTSPMAHLLDLSHRDTVASELNTAIQIYQNESENSTLELIYKQSMVASKELIISGHGQASLVHIQDYFKN